MTRIVALALLASAAASGTWSGPFYKDIPGVGMGQYYMKNSWPTTTPLAAQCKAKCAGTVGCQAAQFCAYGESCYYMFNGQKKNCFLYNNQMDTAPQLTSPTSVGAFALWKYTQGGYSGGGGNLGTCTGPFYKDIAGVGMAQYKFTDGWQGTLSAQCQAKCHQTAGCQAAQFCQSGSSCFYPYGGGAYNCFLYNSQLDSQPQLIYNGQGFVIYKCGNGGYSNTGTTGWSNTATSGTGGGGGSGWSGPFNKDIAGVGMAQYHFTDSWWSSSTLASQCKAKCAATLGCQAAQFCQHGDDCFYPYGGSNKNCFLYNSQVANKPQLIHNGKAFVLWKYGNGGGSTSGYSSGGGLNQKWSPALCVDIGGTGLGGTHVSTLLECKQRCVNSYNCVAAQFSQFSTYNGNCNAGWGQSGCNCYIYDSAITFKQVTNDIRGFRLYKYNRDGCGSSCCPDGSDKPWGSCQCGSAFGCCPDGVTPKVSSFDYCTCQNRRLSVEDDQTPGADGVTITV